MATLKSYLNTPFVDIPIIQTINGVTGAITPPAPRGYYGYVRLNGFGGLADTLVLINAARSAWINKFLVLEMNGAGIITVQANANIIMIADFIMDNVADNIVLFCKAANTFVQVSRSSNA